jgi:hypothetical protein
MRHYGSWGGGGEATTVNLTSPVDTHITGRMTDCMNSHYIFAG